MPSSNLPTRWRLIKFITNTPAKPIARLLLAHGAGAPANSDWMHTMASALCEQQIDVWRFNFGYMQRFCDSGKRSFPAKMPQLCQEYDAALVQCPDDLPLIVAGKSMGGRVASMLSHSAKVKAVCAFGYPFYPPGKDRHDKDALHKKPARTAHFDVLTKPLWIFQGERDPFGNRQQLECKRWPAVQMFWLNDGDHDFKPRVKSGVTQQQLILNVAALCRRKIDELRLEIK